MAEGVIKHKLPLILDGRGFRGTRLKTKEIYSNEEGILVRPTLIRLTDSAIEEYSFNEEDFKMTRRGFKAIWIDIPTNAIILLNDNPHAMVELLTCTFKINYENPVNDFHQHLSEYCNSLQRRISQLDAQVQELLNELETNSEEMETYFMRHRRIRELISGDKTKKEDNEGDENE